MNERYYKLLKQVDHHGVIHSMGVRYLRELAVLNVIYSNLDNNRALKDLDEVQCTWAMWQKFVWTTP